jgi:glutamyl-tRNA reductase
MGLHQRHDTTNQRFYSTNSSLLKIEVQKLEDVNELVFDLLSRAEKNRQKELAEALKRMGAINETQKKIVSDLTSKLVGKLFQSVVENIQRAAINNESKTLEIASKLLISPSIY